MILDMNEDGIPDYDPVTQDLYIYGDGSPGVTGYPVAWNTQCVAYPYREYLETRGAIFRRYCAGEANNPPPENLPPDQQPNYRNPGCVGAGSFGYNFMWIGATLGYWCSHAWGYGFERVKTEGRLSDNVNINYPFYFLSLDNTLVELEKDKIGYGWTHIESLNDYPPNEYRRIMPWDHAAVDYYGSKLQGKTFPKLINPAEVTKESFDYFMIIDGQGKVLMVDGDSITIASSTEKVSYGARVIGLKIITPKFVTNMTGDSGTQVYAIKNNIVYYIGHMSVGESNGAFTVFAGVLIGNNFPQIVKIAPDVEYFGLDINSWNTIAATKNYAKQETLNETITKVNQITTTVQNFIES